MAERRREPGERGGGAMGGTGQGGGAGASPGQSPAELNTNGFGGEGDASGGGASTGSASSLLPAITMPTGGGAIRGIGEKFEVNAVTGTAGLSIPLPASPGRGGNGPQISLNYSSGGGNGPFGLGFALSVPMITRKTDKGLPRYLDSPNHETDTYVLSGAEDLVPVLNEAGLQVNVAPSGASYQVYRYRPRIEGLFARIERRVDDATRDVSWHVTTADNAQHIYGTSAASRVADLEDGSKVFTWYLEETRDDKGNVTKYEYKAEDGAGVDSNALSERSRFSYLGGTASFTATAQKYLKRVFYGNKVPGEGSPPTDFLFEMVFDYGEHAEDSETVVPVPDDTAAGLTWGVRVDPFSSYRSGFEVRTYRLCQRVLMFHRIEAGDPLFVRATEFTYDSSEKFSYLVSVTQAGFKRLEGPPVTWERGEMPPLDLGYQRPEIHDELKALPEKSLEGLAGGTDGSRKQWIDLDGEGIPGVLIDQGGGWFYKENRGDGELKAPRRLHTQPQPSALAGGANTLEDIDGDGRLELVARGRSLNGYFARTVDGDFEPLRGFETVPNINWRDPNLRIIDLDGDGHGDILITEDQAFVWYRSRAKKGFDESKRVAVSFDENQGPRVVFSDAEQSIQLADMSGDGLVDIVRIRNGEICYWPNLGYGRFGAKVALENSPLFTTPDEFHASRVRFGDVDGSGTTDVFYMSSKGTTLYFNRSGNSLQEGVKIHALPPVDNIAQANVADLLGTGTSCLVWSSPIANPSQNVFYVDLLGSKKPHLLVGVDNNLGAITRTTYVSSTKYYLADKKAGIPWLTRLPFPVQVVERMEREDAISGGKFVSRYSYRHGFFDGFEREFRGFARVETLDAEDFAEEGSDPLLYQSPIKTISWFHTGAWLEKDRLEEALRKEYFPTEPPPDPLLEPITVRDNLPLEELVEQSPGELVRRIVPAAETTVQDAREAARALKGSPLRTEVYAEDADQNPALAKIPYVITETNQQVRRLQPSRGEDKYGVFFAYNRESVTISSERKPDDPRVGHEMVLDVDEYGAVTRSVSIVYGRNPAIPGSQPEQQQHYATLSEADHKHQYDGPGPYRLGVQYESRTYEVHNLSLNWAGGQLASQAELKASLAAAVDIRFDDEVPSGTVTRRLLKRQQQTFYGDDNATEAALGEPGSQALPYKTYQLALTAKQVQLLVDRSDELTDQANAFDPVLLASSVDGAYLDRETNGEYWAQSGRAIFAGASDFFLPVAALDPFGATSSVTWDDYRLLPIAATDTLSNVVQSENDYRVLAPRLVTDPNLNRTEVLHDALGLVVATAVMGKAGGVDGDTIDDPTTKLTYDLLAYQDRKEPAYVHTEARETHGDPDTKWQHSYAYSDGFGRVIQQKVQAESGLAPERLGDGSINRDPVTNKPILVDTEPRWVGTGRTVFNKKGNPVKQYEPFFSDTEGYEDETDLVEWGVTPIIRYDSIDRVIRTDLPDGTFTKVEFDSWEQLSFDQNDTCRHSTDRDQDSQWYKDRGSPLPDSQEPSDSKERAAWLSAQHANTPTRVVLDSLGRPFLNIAHNVKGIRTNRVHEYYKTRTKLDVEGNTLAIYDAKQHDITDQDDVTLSASAYATIQQTFDVLGRRLQVLSPDAGERISIQDTAGKPLRSYNARGFVSWAQYDVAQRPTHGFVRLGTDDTLVARMSYGESIVPASAAQALNLRGQLHLAFDSAGKMKTEEVDFKGNVLRASRALALAYNETPNWDALADEEDPDQLEQDAEEFLANKPGVSPPEVEIFTAETKYDALNRVVECRTPDGSVTTPEFNDARLLESSSVTMPASAGGGATRVVFALDYNARGQRLSASHNETDPNAADGAPSHTIAYEYEPETFRVIDIKTKRASDGVLLQHLQYTYDAVGNITEKRDSANWDLNLTDALDGGSAKYRYDALYRLTEATGREHAGQLPEAFNQPPHGSVPSHANDLAGMRDYIERINYDEVGNIEQMRHLTGDGQGASWVRDYEYEDGSNRLLGTTAPSGLPGNTDYRYGYADNDGGKHGSMTSMPNLQEMQWDFADRLQRVIRSTGQEAFYTYNSSGQRVRKVYVHGTTVDERIYLGGLEIYRKRTGTLADPLSGDVEVERETLHVMDVARRVAMVETKTIDPDNAEPSSPLLTPRWRYQLDNHLGSSAMEIDGSTAANVISYEEYHPYGSTAFHLTSAGSEVSAKRYRYTGKERDEESGLYYHGARYYAPWLGRWTAADPAGFVDGLNLYRYSRDNPVNFSDPGGTESKATNEEFNATASNKAIGNLADVQLHRHVKGLSASQRRELLVGATGKFRARVEGTIANGGFEVAASVPAATPTAEEEKAQMSLISSEVPAPAPAGPSSSRQAEVAAPPPIEPSAIVPPDLLVMTAARDQLLEQARSSDNGLEKGVGYMLAFFMAGVSLYEAPFRAPDAAVDSGQHIARADALLETNREFSGAEATIEVLSGVRDFSSAASDSLAVAAPLRAPLGYATGTAVRTPYGPAFQELSMNALRARGEVGRSLLWRQGTMGQSAAAEGQFWALEHPLTPGYAGRMGIPSRNVERADFIEAAEASGTFITRSAPPVGTNQGGGIEVVVPAGGVRMRGFSTGPF